MKLKFLAGNKTTKFVFDFETTHVNLKYSSEGMERGKC